MIFSSRTDEEGKTKCIVVGILGRDSEYSISKNKNIPILKFSIAAEKKEENTKWVSCTIIGQDATDLQSKLVKGNKVMVAGILSKSEYNGKQYENLNVEFIAKMGFDNQGVAGIHTTTKPEIIDEPDNDF